MSRRQLRHWDYPDQFDDFDDDQFDYQDQYGPDQYSSYFNDDYPSTSYHNNGYHYQSPSQRYNGNRRINNAGRRNNQQSVSRSSQQLQALNDEPTVEHIGYLEVVPASNSVIPSKSEISKMAPPGSNIVVNIININHEY